MLGVRPPRVRGDRRSAVLRQHRAVPGGHWDADVRSERPARSRPGHLLGQRLRAGRLHRTPHVLVAFPAVGVRLPVFANTPFPRFDGPFTGESVSYTWQSNGRAWVAYRQRSGRALRHDQVPRRRGQHRPHRGHAPRAADRRGAGGARPRGGRRRRLQGRPQPRRHPRRRGAEGVQGGTARLQHLRSRRHLAPDRRQPPAVGRHRQAHLHRAGPTTAPTRCPTGAAAATSTPSSSGSSASRRSPSLPSRTTSTATRSP